MRVFISWSGERSHDVAIALKNFIGDIIQSVTLFVSDEDIISGERWNKRLEEELQENQYGILSITSDNKMAPWLLFEAGALSNSTHKIPVVPFLYEIEPSELTGSPLLQFQATIYYNKENVKKLINDINDCCGESKLDSTRLGRAFDRCYDEFEAELKQVAPKSNKSKVAESDVNRVILEELLDLTRGSQKMLSSSDNKSADAIERIEQLVEKLDIRISENVNVSYLRRKREFHPAMIKELLRFECSLVEKRFCLLICLSIFRDDLPWMYDIGKDILDIIQSKVSFEVKEKVIREFNELAEFTFRTPILSISSTKESYQLLHKIPMMLVEAFIQFAREYDKQRMIEDD